MCLVPEVRFKMYDFASYGLKLMPEVIANVQSVVEHKIARSACCDHCVDYDVFGSAGKI